MKKTSVYLSPEDEARLARLARREGKSRAQILRLALADYETRAANGNGAPARRFFHFDTAEGDGTSVADIPREELLRGFGE